MVKDEVEPLGGFIARRFRAAGAFSASRPLTALFFILLQNVWLGLHRLRDGRCIQVVVIPRMRRRLIRARQANASSPRASSPAASAEIVEGISSIHVL
jgi:hypothetical protein